MAVNIRSLRRPTLKETYVNLEEWLRQTAEDEKSRSDTVQSCDIDAFDQSIKLIIVDKSQLHDELAKCLFSLDKGVVRRAAKCSWFFKSTPNAFFIEKVFPVVSVSTRLKVITALAKNVDEDRASELYNFIRCQFGFRIAEPLLAKCQKDRIRQILIVEKRLVKPSTFLTVCRRFPDVAIEVAKSWLQLERTIPSCVAENLARNHPEVLKEFTYKQLRELSFGMGRKLSRSMMSTNGDILMDFGWKATHMFRDQGHFLRYFSEKAQVNVLVEFVKFWAKGHLTPDTWKSCLVSIWSWIKYFPAPHRDLLLQRAFKTLFDADLWDSPLAWSTKLLEIVTSDRRAIMLEDPECQADEYIYLWPPVVAVPKLISMVKRTPESPERARLITKMIESCRLTWDLEKLELVCSFAEEQLKDEFPALKQVVNAVLEQFHSSNLPRAVWSFLSRMASLLFSEGHHLESSVLAAHEELVRHCIAHEQEVESPLQAWIVDLRLVLANSRWRTVNILQRPMLPHSKELLLLIYSRLSKLGFNNENPRDLSHAGFEFLQSAASVNLKLSKLPDKGELLANILVEHYPDSDILRNAYRQGLYKFPYFFKHFAIKSPLIKDLLKIAPEVVAQNLTFVVSEMFSDDAIFYSRYINSFLSAKRLLAFYDLSSKISSQCLEAFSEATQALPQSYSQSSVLYVYSHVATMSDFHRLAKPFISTEPKLDWSDPKSRIIQYVPRMLCNINPLQEAIPFILPCLIGGGDLLYQALPAFLSFCYTQPVETTMPVLIQFLDAPVSIKKKVLRILADVCTLEVSSNYFKGCLSRSRHYSERFVLLRCIARCFLENPAQETWNNLKDSILGTDVLILEALPSASDIPNFYFATFVETVWNALSEMKCDNVVENAKRNLIAQSGQRIELLRNDFCQAILGPQLFTDHSFVDSFAVQYLIKGLADVDLSKKLNFILTIFRERASCQSKAVTKFVKHFCEQRSEAGFGELYKNFMRLFGQYFDIPKFMEARLLLKYVELCETAKKESCCNDEFQVYCAIGQLIGAYWLTIPDYAFMVPFFSSSIKQFFLSDQAIDPVLLGIIRDDPVIVMAVLEAFPKSFCYDPLLVKLPPSRESINWQDYLSTSSYNPCHNYVLCFIDKLPYTAVQQNLFLVLSQGRQIALDKVVQFRRL